MAEDLAQESFLKLHRHLAKDGPTPNVRAWFRVAYRMWIDRLRDGMPVGIVSRT
jgi:DNA-directed RNA polymerase specialized sigma24 family protein